MFMERHSTNIFKSVDVTEAEISKRTETCNILLGQVESERWAALQNQKGTPLLDLLLGSKLNMMEGGGLQSIFDNSYQYDSFPEFTVLQNPMEYSEEGSVLKIYLPKIYPNTKGNYFWSFRNQPSLSTYLRYEKLPDITKKMVGGLIEITDPTEISFQGGVIFLYITKEDINTWFNFYLEELDNFLSAMIED